VAAAVVQATVDVVEYSTDTALPVTALEKSSNSLTAIRDRLSFGLNAKWIRKSLSLSVSHFP
jgi:hypothetical protein